MINQFYELLDEAWMKSQSPTRWRFGGGVFEELRKRSQNDAYFCNIHNASKPQTFMGVSFERMADRSLPDGRVVLMSGANSIGAFTLNVRAGG